MKLLHIQHDILALAAASEQGPTLPAPNTIAAPVQVLLERGLLAVEDGSAVVITPAGREALAEVGPPPSEAEDDTDVKSAIAASVS